MRAFLSTALLLLFSCTSPSEPTTTQPAATLLAASAPPKAATAATEIVFDIPALLGKNIDQVAASLGKPSESDAPNLTEGELERRYTRPPYTLVITYETKTRQVTGFFLKTTAGGGLAKNCRLVRQAGNLSPHNPTYELDSLESNEKPGHYTGIVVTTPAGR